MSGGPGLVLALALSTAAGVALIARVAGRAATLQEWIGRLVLGAAAGLGATSLVAFAWLFASDGAFAMYAPVDAALCVVAAALLLKTRGARDALRPPRPGGAETVTVALLLIAAAVAGWRFALASGQMPHGEWDAWEIWNFRARQLFRTGQGWREAFAPGTKSAEYPLLLPLSVVRAWAYDGESTVAPAAIAGLFTVGGPLAVAGLVARLSTVRSGAAAGLLLYATTGMHFWGAHQYADVPESVLVASGAGLLAIALREEGTAVGWAALGGLFLGLAGWTKTDGILAAAVVAVAAAVALARGGGAALAPVLAIGAGAAAPALAWIVQHVVLTPALAPDLTTGQSGFAAKLVDPARWWTTLTWLADHAPGRDVWLLPVALGVAAALGARHRTFLRSPATWSAAALYAAAVVVFVVTSLDLPFHLLTAGDRLMLQPWPLLVLAILAAVPGNPRAGGAEEAHAQPPSSPT